MKVNLYQSCRRGYLIIYLRCRLPQQTLFNYKFICDASIIFNQLRC